MSNLIHTKFYNQDGDELKDLSIFENNHFYKGYSFSIFYFHELETFPLHWHHYVEVIYTMQNGVIFEVNGQKVHMKKGDVLFIWPGELHSIVYQPRPNNTLMLQFDAQLLTDRLDFQKMAYLFYKTRILRGASGGELVILIQNTLLKILDTSLNEENFPEMKACVLIYELMISLGQEFLSEGNRRGKKVITHKAQVEQQMLHVCNYIAAHCTEKITLEQAAFVAGFSKFHFSKLFKEYTGHSFPEFQAKERLRIAETLLMDPSVSVTEASLESGFESISTFNRVFKQFKKVSPTQFRTMYMLSDSEDH